MLVAGFGRLAGFHVEVLSVPPLVRSCLSTGHGQIVEIPGV
jgi:hypothetical protein